MKTNIKEEEKFNESTTKQKERKKDLNARIIHHIFPWIYISYFDENCEHPCDGYI